MSYQKEVLLLKVLNWTSVAGIGSLDVILAVADLGEGPTG